MKNQITIKRSGCFLPTFALVVIFLLVSALLWLSTVGLPQAATDYLTAKVKEETGLTLKVENIRLSPFSGLGVTATEVSLTEPGLPAIYIPSINVSFGWNAVATGRFDLPRVKLHRAAMAYAVGQEPDELLVLDKTDLRIEMRCPQGTRQLHINGTGELQGIHLKLSAILPIRENEEQTDIKAVISDAKEQIRLLNPTLQQVHAEIARQKWETPPSVLVLYSAEQTTPICSIAATVPSYEWQDFHFHHGTLQLEQQGELFSLKRLAFTTTDPYTSFEAKADWNQATQQGAFDVVSSASLVDLTEKCLQEAAPEWLKMIHHDAGVTPHIRLKGDIDLTENQTIDHLRIEGEIEQETFCIKDSVINHASVGFFYENGNLHLDRFLLTLPDGGAFSLTARLKDGDGEANLHLDSNTDYLLNFISHFAELQLPEELTLQGHTVLDFRVSVNSPPFVPGKTELADMIPSLKGVQAALSLGHVEYAEAALDNPVINISANAIDMPFDTLPAGSVGHINLSLSADQCRYDGAKLDRPALKTDLYDIRISHQDADILPVPAKANGRFVTEKFAYGDIRLDGVTAETELPNGWKPGADALRQLPGLQISLKAQGLEQGERFRAENLHTDLTTDADANAVTLGFSCTINGNEMNLRLPLTSAEDSITVHDAQLSCPVAELQPLLETYLGEDFNAITDHIHMPEQLTLRIPDAELNTKKQQLNRALICLSIPELVRTPHQTEFLQGKEIVVGLGLTLQLEQNNRGDFLYRGNVNISHGGNHLAAEVDGNTADHIHITGTNTITADAIDLLIDDEDAHYILRDFRFTPGKSSMEANNIDTTITYDNGLRVLAKCNAELAHVDYQQNAFTETEINGKRCEVYQENVSADTFTHFSQAACGVEVNLQYDVKRQDGTPVPDIQTVNLTHPRLVCDNRAWFTRQNMKGKGLSAETTITGNSVFIDLEKNTLTLNGLKGTAYPANAFGAFFMPLREYLADILLTVPVNVETKQCVFPIAESCKEPTSGVIQLGIPVGARYNFMGTIIPLEQCSCFVTLSDSDVYIDRLNAATWGGVLNGQLRVGFSEDVQAYDGYFTASAMDLRQIAGAFNADFKPAVCDANFRFRAKDSTLNSIEGYGAVCLQDGDLMDLPLFSPIAYVLTHLPDFIADSAHAGFNYVTHRHSANETKKQLQEKPKSWGDHVLNIFTYPGRLASAAVDYSADKATNAATAVQESAAAYVPFANYVATYDLQDVTANFSIKNGFLYSDNLKASGSNLKVNMELALKLADMTINATLHPSFRSIIDTATSPFTRLPIQMIDINVQGPLKDLSWRVRFKDKNAIKEKIKQETEELQQKAIDTATRR